MKSVGRRIENARKSRKLTREKVAQHVDLDPTTIYRIEKAKQGITLENIFAFSEALETPPAAFFTDGAVQIQPTIEEAWEIVGRFIDEQRRRPTRKTSPLLERAADLLAEIDDEHLLYGITGFIRLATSDKSKIERLLDEAGTLKNG